VGTVERDRLLAEFGILAAGRRLAPEWVKYPVSPPATAPAPNSPAPASSPRLDGRAGAA